MITNYRKNWLIFLIITVICLAFLTVLVFFFSFKIDQKVQCHFETLNHSNFLVTNKDVAEYLILHKDKPLLLENNSVKFYIKTKFIKDSNNLYLFAVNSSNLIKPDAKSFIIIPDQHIWEILS